MANQDNKMNPHGIRPLGDEGLYWGDWAEVTTQDEEGQEVVSTGIVSRIDEAGDPWDDQGNRIGSRTQGYWRVCRRKAS